MPSWGKYSRLKVGEDKTLMNQLPFNQVPNPDKSGEEQRPLFWHLIGEHAQQFIGLLSGEGIVLDINSPSFAQHGLQRSEVVGKYLWDTIWWQGRPEAQQLLRDAIQQASQGKTPHFTTTIAGKEGKSATVNLALRPISTSGGKIDYLLPEIRDITDLVGTIEQLSSSKNLLEQANRIAGLGYWSWDIPANHVHLSDELMRIFAEVGKAEETNYQGLMRYIHPEDRVVVRRSIQGALKKDNHFSVQFRITRKDGSLRTLRGLGEVIRDDFDEPTQVIGTVQDITDIQSLENRLLESEKRYRYLVQELPDTGVILYDPDLSVFLVEGDDFVKKYTAGDDVLGMPVVGFLSKIFGESPELDELTFFKLVFEGETHSYEQISGERCYSVSSIPLRNNDNDIYAGMVVIQDITQRVRVAEKLTKLANQLKMLNQLGQLVVSNRNTQNIFEELLRSVRQLVDAQDAFIFLEKNGQLQIEAQNGRTSLNLIGQGMPLTDGIGGEVWHSQKSILPSSEECRAKLFKPLADSVGYTPHSFLAVPITWQDQKFGVFEAVHEEEGKFTQEDLKLVESATAWTAIALNNNLQHARMERALSESEITTKLLEEILSARLSLKSILELVVDAGKTIVQSVEWAAIHLLDERHNQLRLEAVAGVYVPAEKYRLDYGQGIAGRVLESGQLINVADVSTDTRVASYPRESHANSLLVAPIKSREGVVIGTITLQSSNPNQFNGEDEKLLVLLAHQAGLAIENARLYEAAEYREHIAQIRSEQLRQLTHQLVTSQEDERARIARELHDEAGQSLTALKISLELLGNDLPVEMQAARQALKEAADQAGLTLENLRGIAHNLRPPALDHLGLNLALAGLCGQFESQTQISTKYRGFDLPRLPISHEITLYRFVQEALTNIAKHAEATEVQVWLDAQTGMLEIHVQDNGIGMLFDPLALKRDDQKGMGLASMKERLNIIDGKLDVQSVPGNGTYLRAKVALRLRENPK
jgi:PAS domain S-box-containing protein